MHRRIEFTVKNTQDFFLNRKGKGSLFLEGPAGCGKTTAGIMHLMDMISSGVPGSSILVMTPQKTLGFPYENALRSPQLANGGLPSLLTVAGLARRMIYLFWPLVSSAAGFSVPEKPPIFLTMETAQYYMAYLVRPMLEERRLFESVVIDRNRLYSQILDNLNKSAVVGFPHTEIAERLKRSWIGAPDQLRIYDDVQTCANGFRLFCLQHNLLDFSLQMEIFHERLWNQPLCRSFLEDRYRHVIFDNLEEETPVVHDILLDWLPQFDSALLIYDWQAGYRRFLGADPRSAYRLKSSCQGQASLLETMVQSNDVRCLSINLEQALKGTDESHFLFSGCEKEPENQQEKQNISADTAHVDLNIGYIRFYPEMIDWAADTVAKLIAEENIPPGEIVVLTPFLSDALRFSLFERMKAQKVPVRSHRPSRTLREEPATGCILTLAALAHPEWGIRSSPFDVAYAIFQVIDGLDLVRAQLLAEIVYQPRRDGLQLSSFDNIRPEIQERITYRIGERFEKLRKWLELNQSQPSDLDHFIARLFGEILSQPGFGFHTNYDNGQIVASLIESVQKFRWAAGDVLKSAGTPLGREYTQMVTDGLIASQYPSAWRWGDLDAVLVAPATTFLMVNRPVEVQIWLDLGSRGWSERLDQPLTHPYVLSRDWPIDRLWTDMDEFATSRESLLRLIIGLLRRCRRSIYLGISELSEQGYEQRGPLLNAFQRILRAREILTGFDEP